MNKLMRILKSHGLLYELCGEELHVFDLMWSDDYTTLKIVNNKLTVNGEYMRIRDYLGY